MDASLLPILIAWYVSFLFSTSLHEASHALAAYYGGDLTAYRAGQVTLNPLPHIKREKVGMIVVPLLTFFMSGGDYLFGWASAPFNPHWAARYPRRSLIMALAGPFSHLLPIIFSWVAMLIGLRMGILGLPSHENAGWAIVAAAGNHGWAAGFALLLPILFKLNLLLFLFNLMPFPPMDGSEILYQFVGTEEGRLRMRLSIGFYSILGLLAAWKVFPWVFTPIYTHSLILLYTLGLR